MSVNNYIGCIGKHKMICYDEKDSIILYSASLIRGLTKKYYKEYLYGKLMKEIRERKDKFINVNAYNIATVSAEKIETVLSRAEANSRMRDFYDIYLIYTRDWDNINKSHFRKAMENTFKDRGFKGDIQETFEIIEESSILENKWNQYARRNSYCEDLNYDNVSKIVETIVKDTNNL